MRVRDFFDEQAGDFCFLAGFMMLMGVLLVLAGVLIAVFPAILVALVSAAVILAGVGLLGSGWRLRKLRQRTSGFSHVEVVEW